MIKYRGYEIELGGEKYTFAPLSLGAVEMLQDKITAVSSGGDLMREIGAIIDISLASLKRNYPAITREEVAELVDITNIEEIFVNVMTTSGMVSKAGDSTNNGEVDPKK